MLVPYVPVICSGTSLQWTPLVPGLLSHIERCPQVRDSFVCTLLYVFGAVEYSIREVPL